MNIREKISNFNFKNPVFLICSLILASTAIGFVFYKSVFAWINIPIVLGFILISAFFLVILYFSYTEKMKIEKVFLFTALAIGLLYMFSITPFAEPDSSHHYFTSFKFSSLLMFQFDALDQVDLAYANFEGFSGHMNVFSAYQRVLSDLFVPFESAGFIQNGYELSYPIQYLPQALGMTIARLLNLNMIWLFYLGRLFNLLFFVACGYIAIKRVSRYKMMFFAIALMPMSIHQAASYSYDSFINGLCLIMSAYILSMIWEEGLINKSDWIVVLISSTLMAPTKVIYSAILLLLILIPKERFVSTKKRITIISVVIACSVFAILLLKLSSILSLQDSNVGGTWHGGENYNLAYIFENPKETIYIFLLTIKYNLESYIFSCVGYSLAGLSLLIDIKIIVSYMVVLFLCVIDTKKEKFDIKISFKAISFIIIVGVVLATMLSMFLAWTPNDSGVILGVQGRYFLPVVPLVLLLFKTKNLVLEKNIDKHLILVVIFLSLCTISNILSYTIVH